MEIQSMSDRLRLLTAAKPAITVHMDVGAGANR